MVLDAVSNFVRGTADAEVGTEDTTVSVADASIFPDPGTDGEFNVVIWDVNNFPRPDQDGDVEILRVTARDTGTNELTVTRGQEMTSAAAHPEGSAIHLSPTAKMFSDIESTFSDFWNAGTQELTGDVNNTNTTTTTLEAEKAKSRQETNILAILNEDQDISVGDFEPVKFESSKDNTNEWNDEENRFEPAVSGQYRIDVLVGFRAGADGDEIRLSIEGDDRIIEVRDERTTAAAGDIQVLTSHFSLDLEESENYTINVRNDDSSDTIIGDTRFTRLGISREINEVAD